MKGITPIIAIVLLLMITISMAGFAFIWFQRIGTTALNATQAGVVAQQQAAGKLIAIDNVDVSGGKITIRNIGSYTIQSTELSVYKDGSSVTCTWDKTSVPPGGIITCTATISGCTTIKVTAPGNQDQVAC